jgi:hypothetical protein
MQAKLTAFQRSLGIPFAVYEELPEHRRHRPKRRRLLRRARRSGFDVVCVLRLRHLAPTRARVAQLVLGLGVLSSLSPVCGSTPPTGWFDGWRESGRTTGRKSCARWRLNDGAVSASARYPAGFRLADDGVRLVPDPDEQLALAMVRDRKVEPADHVAVVARAVSGHATPPCPPRASARARSPRGDLPVH